MQWISVEERPPAKTEWYVAISYETNRDMRTGEVTTWLVLHRGYPGVSIDPMATIWLGLPPPPEHPPRCAHGNVITDRRRPCCTVEEITAMGEKGRAVGMHANCGRWHSPNDPCDAEPFDRSSMAEITS